MNKQHSLSVVIPAYNEEKNIEAAILQVSAKLEQLLRAKKPILSGVEGLTSYQLIVVDDGSQDRTATKVKQLQKTTSHLNLVQNHPNRGYGGALKAGFSTATKDLIAWFPADLQFDFSEITKLLKEIDHADIVAGYRTNRQDHLIRKLNAAGWNLAIRLLFGYLCRDIDCGFKLFKREILKNIPQLTSERGGMIDPEFLYLAKSQGYKIVDVPLTHLPRTQGESTGANLKVIYNSFRDLFRLWLQLHFKM